MPTVSLTLIRPGDDAPELFWARRCADRSFLGGFHAFFAGGVEPVDRDIAEDFEFEDAALRVAAIRETFEECGLLFGNGEIQRYSRSERTDEVVANAGGNLDLERLEPLGWWRMPKFLDVAYTTAFFGVRLTEGEAAQVDDLADQLDESEFDSGQWIDATQALEKWHRGEVFLTKPIHCLVDTVAAADGVPKSFPSPESFGETPKRAGTSAAGEICGGVVMLPLKTPTLPPATHTNCIVVGKQQLVVIDPGPSDPDDLAPLLDHLERRDGRLEAIALTHHHPDHVGGVQALTERWDVPVIAHPKTLELLPDIASLRTGAIDDGDTIEVDHPGELVAHFTPGHAPGHLAFHQPDIDMVIGGDLVASRGTIIVDPPEGDMGDYLESLHRVLEMNPRVLMPAHGQMTTRPDELLKHYIDHRKMREQKVVDALEQFGPATTKELVPKVYSDAPKAVYPIAERSLLAHLLDLQQRQIAQQSDGCWLLVIGC